MLQYSNRNMVCFVMICVFNSKLTKQLGTFRYSLLSLLNKKFWGVCSFPPGEIRETMQGYHWEDLRGSDGSRRGMAHHHWYATAQLFRDTCWNWVVLTKHWEYCKKWQLYFEFFFGFGVSPEPSRTIKTNTETLFGFCFCIQLIGWLLRTKIKGVIRYTESRPHLQRHGSQLMWTHLW